MSESQMDAEARADRLEAQCAEIREVLVWLRTVDDHWQRPVLRASPYQGDTVWVSSEVIRRVDQALSSSSGQVLLGVVRAAEDYEESVQRSVESDTPEHRLANRLAWEALVAALSRWKRERTYSNTG